MGSSQWQSRHSRNHRLCSSKSFFQNIDSKPFLSLLTIQKDKLGEVVYAELPKAGTQFNQAGKQSLYLRFIYLKTNYFMSKFRTILHIGKCESSK